METGTLKELNVKPGDVVEFLDNGKWYPEAVGHKFEVDSKLRVHSESWGDGFGEYCDHKFRIISRAGASEEATPRTWGEMTDSEKGVIPEHYRDDPTNPLQLPFVEMSRIGQGALLLAAYEGKMIEAKTTGEKWYPASKPLWLDEFAYRIRPEPKRETVELYYRKDHRPDYINFGSHTHCITFDLINGEPDCASIKMEEL